jgi:hypothetical protein
MGIVGGDDDGGWDSTHEKGLDKRVFSRTLTPPEGLAKQRLVAL